MSTPDYVAAVLTKPTCSVVDAGAVLGLTRGEAYAAAKRGEIPTLQFGRRKIVPTALLKRMLAGETLATAA